MKLTATFKRPGHRPRRRTDHRRARLAYRLSLAALAREGRRDA